MAEQKSLSFDTAKQAQDIKYATVSVPEWGGDVTLESLDSGAMLDFADSNEGAAKRTSALRLLAKSWINNAVFDEQGRLIEGTHIPEDQQAAAVDALKSKNAAVCTRVVDALLKLNGFDEKKQAQEKNGSGEARTGASPTVSH